VSRLELAITAFLVIFFATGFIWTKYDAETIIMRIAFAAGGTSGLLSAFKRKEKAKAEKRA